MGLCDGRVCLVTGAGQGIGRAYVEALAAEGALVVVNDVAASAVDDVVAAVRAKGGGAVGHVGDVSTAAGADALIATATDTWGGLDAVVNNAGIARDRMLVNMSEGDWDDVLRVHLKSTFLVTQRAARHWRERSKAGDAIDARVINTVSSVGLYGHVGQANYAAAKGAIASFTLVAAMELARYGATVNAVCPTALTPMTEAVGLGESDAAREGRYDPKWVAAALVWLASPLAADVTGRVIVASGVRLAIAEGWHRGPTGTPVDDPAAVDAVIRPLLAAAAPNADVQGDIPRWSSALS
ncbi:SDR family NAD(P)-dependent oxidoreductase [Pseudofrankia asymbiotica]|uniref:Short-chain dehydrogenase n=1 Tax=Pseudofrankia asymbiotica TaxID=1834516 RepID=A0A1V2IEB1_9ACTN|nr:SDR family NAD(P)-dependent oxidoreductase [Pseudofrankia asymbiotica]ONH30771.1 short-chain dehydrogenase [Pseudofrankia asymbiotica]